MKRFIITLFIAVAAVSVKAQTAPVLKDTTITFNAVQRAKINQVLGTAYNWLPKSEIPANQLSVIYPVIQEVFGFLNKQPEPPKVVQPAKVEPTKDKAVKGKQ